MLFGWSLGGLFFASAVPRAQEGDEEGEASQEGKASRPSHLIGHPINLTKE
jgi:hypothetical protein